MSCGDRNWECSLSRSIPRPNGCSFAARHRIDAVHPCPQPWFNLSDPTVEETWYDPRALWDVLEIDLADEPVLDETTICKFWYFLDAYQIRV